MRQSNAFNHQQSTTSAQKEGLRIYTRARTHTTTKRTDWQSSNLYQKLEETTYLPSRHMPHPQRLPGLLLFPSAFYFLISSWKVVVCKHTAMTFTLKKEPNLQLHTSFYLTRTNEILRVHVGGYQKTF